MSLLATFIYGLEEENKAMNKIKILNAKSHMKFIYEDDLKKLTNGIILHRFSNTSIFNNIVLFAVKISDDIKYYKTDGVFYVKTRLFEYNNRDKLIEEYEKFNVFEYRYIVLMMIINRFNLINDIKIEIIKKHGN